MFTNYFYLVVTQAKPDSGTDRRSGVVAIVLHVLLDRAQDVPPTEKAAWSYLDQDRLPLFHDVDVAGDYSAVAVHPPDL